MKQLISFISYLEAFSALFLFSVAMPVKYIGGEPELVSLVGAIHGFLFVLFVGMLLIGVGMKFPLWKNLGVKFFLMKKLSMK